METNHEQRKHDTLFMSDKFSVLSKVAQTEFVFVMMCSLAISRGRMELIPSTSETAYGSIIRALWWGRSVQKQCAVRFIVTRLIAFSRRKSLRFCIRLTLFSCLCLFYVFVSPSFVHTGTACPSVHHSFRAFLLLNVLSSFSEIWC